jgi:hypothetical protein
MKTILYKWFPVLVLFTIVFNAIAAYGAGNTTAVYANMTAFCGWILVAMDAFTQKALDSQE